ncbi:MAG: hypothetical protein ACRCZF_19945, partial [Gemmataceae bacterium]
MGVGLELLGRPVRCPHCRQVIIAPTTANGPATAGPPSGIMGPPSGVLGPISQTQVGGVAPQFLESLPPPSASYKPPQFDLTPKEAAASIFSEPGHDDDSVFESSQMIHRVELPDAPASLQATEPVVRTPEMLADIPKSPEGMKIPQPPMPRPSISGWSNTSLPGRVNFNNAPHDANNSGNSSDVVNPFVATPAQFGQKPSEVSSPWTKLEEIPAGQPRPLVTLPPLPLSPSVILGQTADRLMAEPSMTGLRQSPRWLQLGLIGLGIYAVLITIFAIWAFFRGGDRGHPLNNIPDPFGEFRPAQRERVVDLKLDDKALPDEQRVRLGTAITLGELKVEPLGIVETIPKQYTIFTGPDSKVFEKKLKQPCLLLKLRLTNLSSELSLFPNDIAFNRKSTSSAPTPYSAVILADGRRFSGGPIYWP